MAGNLPMMGLNPFSGLGQPRSAADKQKLIKMIEDQMMGQDTSNVGGGMSALAQGALLGMQRRNSAQGAFPSAPGGAQPSPLTGLRNFFLSGRNGGLY